MRIPAASTVFITAKCIKKRKNPKETREQTPNQTQAARGAVHFPGCDRGGAAAGVFYVTNYMMVKQVGPVALPTPTPTAASTPAATVTDTVSVPTPTAVQATAQATADPDDWRAKFADKFTDGDVVRTENSYQSANICITIEKVLKYDVTCYVADIYVADLKYFRTAFAKNSDVMEARS
jgi:hypothetical protein